MKWLMMIGVMAGSTAATSVAHAVEWGTQVSVYVSDIFSSELERNTTIVSAGGPGVSQLHVAIDDQVTLDSEGDGPHSRGRADAAAALRPRAHAPAMLQAEAITFDMGSNKLFQGQLPDGAILGATAFSSDLFEYIGTQPTRLSLNYDMRTVIHNSPTDPTGRSGVRLQAAVLADTPQYQFVDQLSTLLQEYAATLLDTADIRISQDSDGDEVISAMSLIFDVVPGQKFFVWQKLTSTSVRGLRVMDAFAPVIATFDQPELVRSLSVVPEPRAMVLVAIAIAGLAAHRMARRRAGNCDGDHFAASGPPANRVGGAASGLEAIADLL